MQTYFDSKFNFKYFSKDSIYLFKNVMDDKLSNDIVSFFSRKQDEKSEFFIEKKNNFANCHQYLLNCMGNKNKEHSENVFDSKVLNIFNKYSKFLICNTGAVIKNDEGYIISKIYDTTTFHTGPIKTLYPKLPNIRSFTAFFCINTSNSDCFFKFPNQNIQIKIKNGDLICFPPYWNYPYYIIPPKNNHNIFTIHTYLVQ
jgi:hypothetical protein